MECADYCNHPKVDRPIKKPWLAEKCPYLTLMTEENMKKFLAGEINTMWIAREI